MWSRHSPVRLGRHLGAISEVSSVLRQITEINVTRHALTALVTAERPAGAAGRAEAGGHWPFADFVESRGRSSVAIGYSPDPSRPSRANAMGA